MRRRRLFAACTVRPWHAVDGYALRVRALLEGLGRSWSIHLAAPGDLPEGASLASLGIEAFTSLPIPREAESSILGKGEHVDGAGPVMRELVEAERPDALLLWPGTEFLLFGAGPWPHAVCDRIDSSTLTWLRDWPSKKGLRAKLGQGSNILDSWSYERRLLARAAATVVVGEDDARALRRTRGGAFVQVIANGVGADRSSDEFDEAEKPTIVFTGVLCYPPNEEAAAYFAREVLPRVRERMPEVTFWIAGRDASDAVRALEELPGVVLRENVPDMAEVLGASWVAVAPMQSGAGIKNKVLEAWALAKPVVMTRLASNGLALAGDLAACAVDSPEAMADRVSGMLESRDERLRLGKLGLELVREQHDWQRMAAELSGLLDGSGTEST